MEENFNPQQSLATIESMIAKTKSNLSENRFYFLLWGWVSFLAFVMQFFLKAIMDYRHHYVVWLVTIPAVIITIWYSARRRNVAHVKTYLGESMGNLWMGIGISFFILSIIISNLPDGWFSAYPFFILFYGLGTFVSGKILQFRPLVIGGIFNWVLAIICIYTDYDYQMLLGAMAILTSYIIPGHLLKNEKN
jgi:hypothetical protein